MLFAVRFLFLASLVCPCAVWAQTEEEPFTFQVIQEEFAAPFTTEAKFVFWTGTASTLFLLATPNRHIVDETQEAFQKEKPIGKASIYGDLMGQLIPNVLYVGGQAVAEKWGLSEKGYRRSVLMAKATIYTSIVTLTLKNIVREQRPNGGDRFSFPSGHSTTAFAFASVVAAEHSMLWGMSAYCMAMFVALSRINDNAHYLHDVVAGATIGSSFGLGLYYLQPEAKRNEKTALYILPQRDGWMAMASHTF